MVTQLRSRDYDNMKQDGGVRKTKCVSSNNLTDASINHAVTVIPRIFLLIYLYKAYLGEFLNQARSGLQPARLVS